uniref:Uncharacterized protein LOC100175574 n=1 Tax=Phallusia mammillata TaxID=59560 RepID=A0A6F9DFS0_9ASCI|nr:uncharacterized protein LOC100175574 [Phallusia mammillata]
MILLTASCIISIFITTFLLLICTKTKKSPVKTVSYQPKVENNEESTKVSVEPLQNDNRLQQKPPNQNGNEYRRPHSSSQTSRELPQVPVMGHDSISQNSYGQHNGSTSELSGSGGSPEIKHHSPKGRRLPTPPPEDLQVSSEQLISVTVPGENEDDEDMYAKVEERPKSDTGRIKIKTLDVPEGSGDSSFYAKVGDVVVEDGDDLYAQVDNPGQVTDKSGNSQTDTPSTSFAGDSSKTSAAEAADKINYGDAEYASIDKMRKSIVRKKTATNEEPPAPPIPERNFDPEDELNETEEANDEPEERNGDGDETQEQSENSQAGPMYAKLCVRESLDHLRHRQEVENERRQRYANIIRPDNDLTANTSEVYAQIEENNPEAVYESVSASGSADGAFQPPNQNTPGYQSIQDVRSGETASENDVSAPTTSHHPNNTRVARQHHYEQIERPT